MCVNDHIQRLSAPDKIPEAIFLKYFAGGKNILGRRRTN